MIAVNPSDYTLEIDTLHRNVWPVRFNGQVVGELREHMTLALDGGQAPLSDWSWKLNVSEGDDPAYVGTRARYATRDEALAQLSQVHHAIYQTGTR